MVRTTESYEFTFPESRGALGALVAQSALLCTINLDNDSILNNDLHAPKAEPSECGTDLVDVTVLFFLSR